MTDLSRLSDAHLVLLAVQLCTNGDISQLPNLRPHFRNPPSLEVLLRIVLTFLPESVKPDQYAPVLNGLALEPSAVPADLDIGISAVTALSTNEARKQVRKLRLLPLRYPGRRDYLPDTPLVQFLVHRAYRIDSESGVQTLIHDLIERFVKTYDVLGDWTLSSILPLVRFNYEYHPNKNRPLSLELLESLDSKSAVNTLLSHAERLEKGGNVDRDLRGLVGPWIYGHQRSKRRKLNGDARPAAGTKAEVSQDDVESSGWQDVNEWLLSTSMRDFPLVVEAVIRWDGPRDADLGGYDDPKSIIPEDIEQALTLSYGKAALAAIYTLTDCDTDTLEGACRILSKIASLLQVEGHSTLHIHNDELLPISPNTIPSDTCRRNFLHNALLEPTNPLTRPSYKSVNFLDAILVSVRVLNGFGHSIPPRHAAETCLLGNDESQLLELREVLEILKRESKRSRNLNQVREQLLWLRNWGVEPKSASDNGYLASHGGLFWRISSSRFEKEILNVMLMARGKLTPDHSQLSLRVHFSHEVEYSLAVSIYTSTSSPLSREETEAAVTDAIYVSYDNASNGNKTRGGMKRATEM